MTQLQMTVKIITWGRIQICLMKRLNITLKNNPDSSSSENNQCENGKIVSKDPDSKPQSRVTRWRKQLSRQRQQVLKAKDTK